MSNPLHPDRMTSEERLDEVARIIATAILRDRKNRTEQIENSEKFPLDNSHDQWPYGFEPDQPGERP